MSVVTREYVLRSVTDKDIKKLCSEEPTLEDIHRLKLEFDKIKEVGYALAANQIKWDKPIPRVFVGRMENKEGIEVFINPKILSKSEPFPHKKEGCLSIGNGLKKITTLRYQGIHFSYKNEEFKETTEDATGLRAVIIQHEIDHLDGVTIRDRRFNKPTVAKGKPSPNDPCHCGSGKKYKKCCQGG